MGYTQKLPRAFGVSIAQSGCTKYHQSSHHAQNLEYFTHHRAKPSATHPLNNPQRHEFHDPLAIVQRYCMAEK